MMRFGCQCWRAEAIAPSRYPTKTPGFGPGAADLIGPTKPAKLVSGDLEILRGRLAAIGHELVLDHLPLIEAAEAGPFDRRDVNENVFIPDGRLDEPIALRRLKQGFSHRKNVLSIYRGRWDCKI
jgi:hypothetical protein